MKYQTEDQGYEHDISEKIINAIRARLKILAPYFSLSIILWDDVEKSRKSLDTLGGYGKRQFVRTVFSTIEGVISARKQEILKLRYDRFGQKEIFFLEENQFDLKDNGDINDKKPLNIDLMKNINFTSKMFLKAFDVPQSVYEEVKVDKVILKSLEASKKIRNRITHPKKLSDLNISDDELEQVESFFDWFKKKDEKLLSKILYHFENEAVIGEILKRVGKMEISQRERFMNDIDKEMKIMSDEILHCISITSERKDEAMEKLEWMSDKFLAKASLVVNSVLYHI